MSKQCILANLLLITVLLTGAVFLTGATALAAELPAPTGKVILTVSGNIENTNGDGLARFDRSMLESLGVTRLSTKTYWTEGVGQFDGILARTLIAAVGARGETVKATALNEYSLDIPTSDFLGFDVLLALKLNGTYLRTRDKGPVWVVYPLDQNPELDTDQMRNRWIWQLSKLNFH